jgi:hypothetical protein
MLLKMESTAEEATIPSELIEQSRPDGDVRIAPHIAPRYRINRSRKPSDP